MVSPDYLEVCYKEAIKYDFTLQGYGTFEKALKGLLKTNISEILGYVYFANKLPSDMSAMLAFLDRVELCSGNHKFSFVLEDSSGLNMLNLRKYHAIRFYYIPVKEIVTDIVINRDVFGAILLDNYTPYVTTGESSGIADVSYHYSLRYKPLFSTYILQCLQKVNRHSTFEETLSSDSVYLTYKKDNSILAKFREYYIKSYYTQIQDVTELMELLEKEKDNINYGIYKALIAIIDNKQLER